MDEAVEVVENVEAEESEAFEETVENDSEVEAATALDEVDINGVIESLKGEISSLRDELRQRDAVYERASAECAEFVRLYPNVPFSDIPKSVWEMARGGVPLAAAYAYGDVLRRKKEAEIAEADRRSREASPGSLSGGGDDFYSPDEVRRMSPEEVRANYKKITESMKKWH